MFEETSGMRLAVERQSEVEQRFGIEDNIDIDIDKSSNMKTETIKTMFKGRHTSRVYVSLRKTTMDMDSIEIRCNETKKNNQRTVRRSQRRG